MAEQEKGVQALILAGGFGTRLRPLTLSHPKSLIPFCNMPILEHQVVALVKVGVKRIVLAVSFRPHDMGWFVEYCQKEYGVEIVFSVEDEPLGTAGPLALARKHINSEYFFVLNSDVISIYPFQDLLDFHKSHGREGTLMVTQVAEPSKYGVIVSNKDGLILKFVEKPKEFVGDKINAGMYCFSQKILDRIKPVKTSIETEIFPRMVADEQLCSKVLEGYWMDIGQPKDYLTGSCLHLQFLEEKAQSRDPRFKENVQVHSSAVIGEGCVIGPNVVIGKNCKIEDGVQLHRSVLFDGVHVKRGSYINSCIIGWDCEIGEWCRLEDHCVLERSVRIANGIHMRGALVCSHKAIKDHVREPKSIL